MPATPARAVVLLSGGLDSTTTLAIALQEGFRVHALTVQYGQRHAGEVAAARRIAHSMGAVEHVVCDVDLRRFGGSALTGDLDVPTHRSREEMAHGIPVTYVPARNTVFLSLALAWSETLGTGDIFLGVNAIDYSGYPDCRPEYIVAFQRLANLATKGAVERTCPVTIHTPLIDCTKGEIIRRGLALGVDYALTCSCYVPAADGSACGRCDACLLRLQGFADNGLRDPIRYVDSTP
ncbi:MAG: 7-cyano-7-deazaguanine synthase QueC [Pirellulaceae bacterium]|jgi:7-cyano-7-deazaguanine synthase|nr:7-cyano-7-deazaguanine synthase QueC [Pirellulaceae bacterium]